jgi:hypothetical protein
MRTIGRASGIAVAVALIATALPAVGAFASPPVHTRLPFPDFRLEGACNFPVLIHATANRSRVTTFGDGHLRITGTLKVTMTNLRSGQHVGINSTGPATVWPQPGGGVIVNGRGIGFIALSFGPGEPGGFLLQTKGQVVADRIDLHLVHGTSRDICPMIS